jgi:energy-coupling factor transporter transmembrane protein EcfT
MENMPFLQTPPGRRYVRSFLFSRRIDAPFARIHFGVRVLLVLCLSGLQIHTINTASPDPLGAALLLSVSLLIFAMSGVSKRVAILYAVIATPTVLSLFITWILFNPVAGTVTLVHFPLYSGHVNIGLAVWQVIWLIIVGTYFAFTRKVLAGIFGATLLVLLLAPLLVLPEWTLVQVPLYHQLNVFVSDRSLVVALSKVLGYTGMVLCTIALVITSRDVELIGTLRQLRVPQTITFFLSTVFRALELALSDFETIRLAQIARAINARPRSFFRQVMDVASIAVPMVAIMIRRSGEIGDAIIARGYTIDQKMLNFHETKRWTIPDWGMLVLSLICLYLAFQTWNLTAFFMHV